MSRKIKHKFGWEYPAGAEHDPNAPWNKKCPPDRCKICGVDLTPGMISDWEVFCSDECSDKEDDSDDYQDWT